MKIGAIVGGVIGILGVAVAVEIIKATNDQEKMNKEWLELENKMTEQENQLRAMGIIK